MADGASLLAARERRWLLPASLGVLLLAEVLYLTVSFDSQRLDGTASPWTVALGSSPQFLRIAIVVGVVALLLSGREEPPLVRALTRRPAGWTALWTAVHLLAFAEFAQVTARLFSASAAVSARPASFALAWMTTGAVAICAWALALRPAASWWADIVRRRALLGLSLVLGTAAWAGGFLTEVLWAPLARGTFAIVATVLGFMYPSVVSDPARLAIGTPAFRVSIAPACSGYEGMGLIAAFLAIYLWASRRDLRFPAALVLLPVGVAAIWVLNALRLVALIAIGSAGWRDVALGGFHSQAGWITFNALGLAIVWVVQRRGYFAIARDTTVPVRVAGADDPTVPLLAPFTAVLAAAMLTGALAAGEADWLYPARVVVAAAVLWWFRSQYRDLGWSCSWVGPVAGAAAFALWVTLVPGDSVRDTAPSALARLPGALAAAWLAVRIFGYVAVTPLVEELAFRAYLARRLVDSDVSHVQIGVMTGSALVVSSLVFGAFHGAAWLPATLAGLAFALALGYRRQLADAVLAHAATNGLVVLYVLTTGRWSLWS